MTFENAIKFKKTLPEKIIISEMEYTVMVVPENQNDLKEYYKKYLNHKFTDETAIEYSSNNNFEVYAIKISNGILITSKKLS